MQHLPLVVLVGTALLVAAPEVAGQDLTPGMTPAEEWEIISDGGTRRVFNLGIGSLFNFASRQFTEQDKSLDPSLQSELVSPVMPQMVNGMVREFSYCWRYIAASGRECTSAETAGGTCKTLGAFFEIFEDGWQSLREREASYELLPVTPQMPPPRDSRHGVLFCVGRLPARHQRLAPRDELPAA